MSSCNLSKISFTNDSDADLDKKVHEICIEFPYCGELLLKELLKNNGTIVQRSRLRDNIHRVDEAGVSLRKKGNLERRMDNVKAPNKLWHIDTNHKLVR